MLNSSLSALKFKHQLPSSQDETITEVKNVYSNLGSQENSRITLDELYGPSACGWRLTSGWSQPLTFPEHWPQGLQWEQACIFCYYYFIFQTLHNLCWKLWFLSVKRQCHTSWSQTTNTVAAYVTCVLNLRLHHTDRIQAISCPRLLITSSFRDNHHVLPQWEITALTLITATGFQMCCTTPKIIITWLSLMLSKQRCLNNWTPLVSAV